MRAPRLVLAAVLGSALLLPVVPAGAATAQSCPPECGGYPSPHTTPNSQLGPFKNDAETRAFIALRPYIRAWADAVHRRDQAAAQAAGLQYEIHWQGPEIWTQHRTLPAYTDLENDAQFGLDAAIAGANPDWEAADELVDHLARRMEAIILNASNGPELSPIFEDLYHVRRARAYLNVARDEIINNADFNAAANYVDDFAARWDAPARAAVSFRNSSVTIQVNALLNGLSALLRNPNASPAAKTDAFNAFNARVSQAVNLVNNAARGATPPAQRVKPVLDCRPANVLPPDGGTDFKNLGYVGLLQVAVSAATTNNPAPADLSTNKGSVFDKLSPALEAKSRFILSTPTLRKALRDLEAAAGQNGSQAALDALKAAANDQLDLARQTLWGEFWRTTALINCNTGQPGALQP